MAAVAMAVGATAGAARAVVDKGGEARASRASNWRRVSAVATWWHGLESGAQSRAQGRAQGRAARKATQATPAHRVQVYNSVQVNILGGRCTTVRTVRSCPYNSVQVNILGGGCTTVRTVRCVRSERPDCEVPTISLRGRVYTVTTSN